MNYYNEFDPKAAAWLRELIHAGLIPYGYVDTRSIAEVKPHEIRDFTQCHFFAGIGGWAYALKLAGWPEDRPVWTGSCPCQPFSCAGKGLGTADERHLWPVFFNLIRQCRPAIVFGEQVSSKPSLSWLDGVCSDLEGENYACGASDLCAAGVEAPHIRQRLFWVAVSELSNRRPEQQAQRAEFRRAGFGGSGGLDDAAMRGRREGRRIEVWSGFEQSGFWSDSIWHECRDGKARRISSEPALFPLAHGIPGRVGMLRGAGNAIVPQVAAEFIKAFLEIEAAANSAYTE